ncbi:hypothetical protein AVEN_162575-1, partial [Araneus ventricosus]
MWDLKNAGIFSISLLGRDPDLSRRFHVASRPVGETIKGPCSDHRRIECVDRLGSPLACEHLWNLSLEFYPLCELETFFPLPPLKPRLLGRKRHELDSPNLGNHFPQPFCNIPLRRTEMGCG